jgi:hypothetical protein
MCLPDITVQIAWTSQFPAGTCMVYYKIFAFSGILPKFDSCNSPAIANREIHENLAAYNELRAEQIRRNYGKCARHKCGTRNKSVIRKR